ncbi:hypothetical protein EOD42_03725 [Rhodovarius crocodyli]|uniref:Uncharacterized protein n=1 Tax=Rhodovarius crocodyli TaxID=1979269 RepID=A0A437MNN6_9PROT|nr:hypothetical protein [Rhodovarius crocodyli]RVT99220.1 hypothetical protein EOD42_03725 [Rhodovarius crocodyli]
MFELTSQFTPVVLGVFMLALALAPLALVWSDGRKAARNAHLRRLKADASLASLLANRQQTGRARLTALKAQAD